MSMTHERLNAIRETRKFLESLLAIKHPVQVKQLKNLASTLLRHYPEDWWIEDVGALRRFVRSVKIEVRGGVADLVYKDAGVNVQLVDFDGEQVGERASEQKWEADERVPGP